MIYINKRFFFFGSLTLSTAHQPWSQRAPDDAWRLMPCQLMPPREGPPLRHGVWLFERVHGRGFLSLVPRDFSKRALALSSLHSLWGGYWHDTYTSMICISPQRTGQIRPSLTRVNLLIASSCRAWMGGDVEILSKGTYIRADACDPSSTRIRYLFPLLFYALWDDDGVYSNLC